MRITKEETSAYFDNSFKEHPIISFTCTLIIGALVFIVIYVAADEALRFDTVAETISSASLSTFFGAFMTTIVALAGAVVTVVLARLGLKLGENAEESSASLHSFEYRAAARQELVPAINAIRALGSAAVSFVASSRPLRLAMTRHMQIRGLSEGTQSGPAHPVEFMAYKFDRSAHAEELGYFLEKANALKTAIDDVMLHQIAIVAMDSGNRNREDLMEPRLREMTGMEINSGGNSFLDKLHLVRDYLENNIRTLPDDTKIGWAVLAAEWAGASVEDANRAQALPSSQNVAFAGWVLARHQPDGTENESGLSFNFGFAELMDLFTMLPTKIAVLDAAAGSHPEDEPYRDIIMDIAKTMPLLPRAANQQVAPSAILHLLEIVPRDVKLLVLEDSQWSDLLENRFLRNGSVETLLDELKKTVEIGMHEVEASWELEDYDLWLHGALMQYTSLPPLIRRLDPGHRNSIYERLTNDIQYFFRAYGRSCTTEVELLRAMANTTLTLAAYVNPEHEDHRCLQFLAIACNLAAMTRGGGLSVQGRAQIMGRIDKYMHAEHEPVRKSLMQEIRSLATSMPDETLEGEA